jgi:ribosome biogenesis protein BMS1
LQDITNKELIRQNSKCDRSVVVFGYLRGCNLRPGQRIHVAGVDDFAVEQVEQFPDPCPLPHMLKKRTLNEQERRIYAPMSDVGGLLYDKDAVYIDIPDWKVQYTRSGVEVPKQLQEVSSYTLWSTWHCCALQRMSSVPGAMLASTMTSVAR